LHRSSSSCGIIANSCIVPLIEQLRHSIAALHVTLLALIEHLRRHRGLIEQLQRSLAALPLTVASLPLPRFWCGIMLLLKPV
jgi:hypothetical protein